MTRESYPGGFEEAQALMPEAAHYNSEKPGEECGVFAVFSPGEPVARLTYYGLHGLQHRGQAGAGIITNGDNGLTGHIGEGLIDTAIPEAKPVIDQRTGKLSTIIDEIAGSSQDHAIGHVRYPTKNGIAQPILRDSFALATNGHVEGIDHAAKVYGLDSKSSEYRGDSDLSAALYAKRANELGSMALAILEVSPYLEGAYSTVISDGEQLYVFRDPWAHRPLSMGQAVRPDGQIRYAFSSEPVALPKAGVEYVRDLEPGELIVVNREHGLRSLHIDREEEMRRCMFEYIYFARPDTDLDGVGVYLARENMGRWLYKDHHVEADIVIGVRESGMSAAKGYSKASGLFNEEGFFKNPYAVRCFIEDELVRNTKLADKQRTNADVIAGQRVILVDDSIVRGDTMSNLVADLRGAGATEVHVRSAAPRYLYPCYMGMDTRDDAQLIARSKSDAEIAATIGADSVAFNSIKRIKQSVTMAVRTAKAAETADKLCDACATGNYAFEVPPCTTKLTNPDAIAEHSIQNARLLVAAAR